MRVVHCFLMTLMLPLVLCGQEATSNGCSLRSIPLTVLDRQYRFVDNLGPPNIRITAGNHSITVNRITLSSPRRLMLLLDVSGSMVQSGKYCSFSRTT